MPRARASRAFEWVSLIAIGSIALAACKQSNDLVVRANSLDGGDLGGGGGAAGSAGASGTGGTGGTGGGTGGEGGIGIPMEEPMEEPMEDPTVCLERERAYNALRTVWNSRPQRCIWAFDDQRTLDLLIDHIFSRPPAPLTPEVDQPGFCEAFLPHDARFAYATKDGARLCAGYCKALGLWVSDPGPLISACLPDGGV
jgi:hypothetical protein